MCKKCQYHTLTLLIFRVTTVKNQDLLHYARQTVSEAGAIALGIIAVAAITHILQYLLEHKKK